MLPRTIWVFQKLNFPLTAQKWEMCLAHLKSRMKISFPTGLLPDLTFQELLTEALRKSPSLTKRATPCLKKSIFRWIMSRLWQSMSMTQRKRICISESVNSTMTCRSFLPGMALSRLWTQTLTKTWAASTAREPGVRPLQLRFAVTGAKLAPASKQFTTRFSIPRQQQRMI